MRDRSFFQNPESRAFRRCVCAAYCVPTKSPRLGNTCRACAVEGKEESSMNYGEPPTHRSGPRPLLLWSFITSRYIYMASRKYSDSYSRDEGPCLLFPVVGEPCNRITPFWRFTIRAVGQLEVNGGQRPPHVSGRYLGRLTG